MSGGSDAGSLVEVALPLPLFREFTYRVEGDVPAPGTRLLVPFRARRMVGWSLGPGPAVPGIRDVVAALDRDPSVGPELLELARWMADYYVAPVGQVLRAMVPAGLAKAGRVPEPKPRTLSVVRLTKAIETLDELEAVFGRAKRQRELYELLQGAGGRQYLAAALEAGFSRSVVHGLRDKGLARIVAEEVLRDPFAGEPVDDDRAFVPTADQKRALEPLVRALDAGGGSFLLHGVTSSGKTLVYIELIRAALARGAGAIALVPEIALTPQTVSRFRQAFGDQVAVVHSGLSEGERFDAWKEIKAGRRRIVVGARSAVFAPVECLGAIVVDEEHDGSYKQSESPRYHARDVAVVRALRAGAVCLLGSATPSLESWTNAKSGKYALLELPERIGSAVLPRVRVVDLREREETALPPRPEEPPPWVLSPKLMKALRARLARGEQAILLLNRRGYATFAQCRSCGHVPECVQCSVSLTLHRQRDRMVCHHCGHTESRPRRCSQCGWEGISYRGLGTEQLERVLREAAPGARVARMDVDTTRGKWSHADILKRFRTGKVDILLGTQMIAKGLDFPRVTLVGVVNADVGLHLPDFRSSERTFQLLSQVAGRAGRGDLPGEVFVQTYVPDHYAVQAAVAHDYEGFVRRELHARAEPLYPPHLRVGRLLVSSPNQAEAIDAATALDAWLGARGNLGVAVLGPAPAPIERLHGRYRWHVLLRGGAGAVGRALRAVALGFKPEGADVRVAVDRDPQQLL